MDALEQAAKAIYESLSAAGHGPRPWAAQSHNAPPWEQLPHRHRAEYLQAAKAAREQDGQMVLEPGRPAMVLDPIGPVRVHDETGRPR